MQEASYRRRARVSTGKDPASSRTSRAKQAAPIRVDERLCQLHKVDVLGQLAAGIAHDLNNILTAIVGYAELLDTSEEPTGQVKADIGEIRRAAQRAASLTGQILAFARKDKPQPKVIDVNAVVMEMTSMLKRVVGEHIDVSVGCNATPVSVRLDAGQLEQIIVNLVMNARDAMPHGGRITIETQTITANAFYAASHAGLVPGRYGVLQVTDQGIGMDEKTRARLFEPFFTTKGSGAGTGLGLSIVSTIVESTGGRIFVQSAPGTGTRFTIFLPLASEGVREEWHPLHERRVLTGHGSVLLVEDDAQVRSLAALWLRRHGYDVYEATNGEEALTAIARGNLRVDLLITDMVMPAMGGGTLAASLRERQPWVKVLYISGYAPRPEIAGQLEEPGSGFLQKPFSPNQLLNSVRRLVWTGPERRVATDWKGPSEAADDGRARPMPRASSETRRV
jgi:signal transduction histidine kinase/CheY-like chemotaxis protein